MCQAIIPQFRARRAGAIVNVTSSASLAPFALVAAYTAAIEGFTTAFAANGQARMQGLIPGAYEPFAHSGVHCGFVQIRCRTKGQPAMRPGYQSLLAVPDAAASTRASLRPAGGRAWPAARCCQPPQAGSAPGRCTPDKCRG